MNIKGDIMIPKELSDMYKTAYQWNELILDVAADYDGYNTVDGLKELIDEIRAYSLQAMKCIDEGKSK